MSVLFKLESRRARGAEYRSESRKGCLKGTRGAVLEAIELWINNFDKPSIYWLNGLAGTGKSTIAQTIAERTFADGKLGASFFCSRDFEDQSNLQFIFPTLAVQLARKHTEFRSILVRLDSGIVDESLYRQMERLIVEPLRDSGISTVIVIDALDECKDNEPASAILSVLGQFVSQIPKVKFFLTGRPERRISEGFRLPQTAKATDVFVLHEVKPSEVDSDIRLFFEKGFLEIARRRRLDGWPTKEQVDRLCKRAAGLFVYAVATVKFVDHRNNGPRGQLDALLRSPERSDLEGATELKADITLNSLYASILDEAFGKDHCPDDDKRVRSVLGAIILAANPLSPSAIAALLDLDTDHVFLRLLSVHSLLTIQEVDNPVRPFHKSFPDFIVDPSRCTNPRFCVSRPDQHSKLLIGCLKLMYRRLEKNMCDRLDAVTIDRGLRYACESWHKHFADAHAVPAHTLSIISVLHRFLENKFLFWLEVLSILGTVRDAVDALEAAAKWLGVLAEVRSEVCQVYARSIHFPDLLILDTGITDSRPCRRLLPICHRVLRGHQHVRSTHLSLRPPPIPPKVKRAEVLQTVHPTLGKDCARGTNLVGSGCCNYEMFPPDLAYCVVAVRQVHRDQRVRFCHGDTNFGRSNSQTAQVIHTPGGSHSIVCRLPS